MNQAMAIELDAIKQCRHDHRREHRQTNDRGALVTGFDFEVVGNRALRNAADRVDRAEQHELRAHDASSEFGRREQLGDGREAREAAEIREADEEDRYDAETQRRSERVQPEHDRQRPDTTEQHSAVTEALRQDAEHQRHRDRADALGGDECRGAAALVMEQLERDGRNECDERRGEQRVEREVTQQGA